MAANGNEALLLLSNASATGTAKTAQIGGRYVFNINGTFGGTTAQLQLLGADGVNYINLANGSFTAAGAVAVDVPQGGQFLVTLTGGAPSAMYAQLVRAQQG